jgi:hypothetical protein
MAFCNSCGANLDAGAQFCSKCGAVISGGPVAPSYAGGPPAPPKSNSAVKIVLIAVGAIVALGLLGTVATTLIGLRIARHTKIETSDGKVRVQSPFGTVETTKDPEEAAKQMGIDLYPGARVLQGGAASVNVGSSHTVAANFESDDPPDKIAEFYKSKFPNAKFSTREDNNYSIISSEGNRIVTIHIEPQGDKTMIHIASVKGNAVVLGDTSKD